MADTVMTLVVHLEENAEGAAEKYVTKRKTRSEFVTGLHELLGKFAGIEQCSMTAWVDKSSGGTSDVPGQRSKTNKISFEGVAASGDTVVLGNTTITYGSGNDVAEGSTADDSITNMAKHINDNHKGVFSATADTTNDNLEVTCYGPPLILGHVDIAVTGTNLTIDGSATDFGLDTTDSGVVAAIEV